MFINIGGKFIRTRDIRIVDEKKKAITDYQGTAHVLGVNAETLVKEVNAYEKENCGLSFASSCEPLKPQV